MCKKKVTHISITSMANYYPSISFNNDQHGILQKGPSAYSKAPPPSVFQIDKYSDRKGTRKEVLILLSISPYY